MRRATSSTRSRVSALMSGLLLIARETVIFETSSSRAMSARVTGMIVVVLVNLTLIEHLRYKEFAVSDVQGYPHWSPPRGAFPNEYRWNTNSGVHAALLYQS